MSSTQTSPAPTAYAAARIHTLTAPAPLEDHAVVVEGERVAAVVPRAEAAGAVDLGDVDLAPGFVDVQVNGGGGVLFNDDPSVAALMTIADAHRAFGTTALVPTLITATAETMAAARAAVDAAIDEGVPGVLGIHFEGPFLDPRKPGAHDPALVRPPSDEDLDAILDGARGVTVVTAAACCLDEAALAQLRGGGARLALGHCASTYDEARDAFAAGVTGVTHLYNAMSPMESRAPGLVGAALATDGVTSGLIVDGVHVAYGAVRAAWRAAGTDGIMLVTDAVQPVGSDVTEFELGGQRVRLVDGRCINEDGNLAGSALDMASAVRNAVRYAGIPLADALRMASLTPSRFLGVDDERGSIAPGLRADFVALDDRLEVVSTIVGGAPLA
ncbi:MAG: N-acetylglucosamine-6-phosphate deacetylase [Planctomycetota bacterium]